MTNASLMHEVECPKSMLWDNLEGWGGDGGWRGFQDGGAHLYLWLIHVDIWKKPTQYCRLLFLQLQ